MWADRTSRRRIGPQVPPPADVWADPSVAGGIGPHVLRRPWLSVPLDTLDGMDRTPDARLALLARRQAGAFNRSQAASRGLDARRLRARVRAGEIEQLDDDVWAFTSAPAGWLRDCWAATLIHPLAALSHETGAAQLRLDVDRSYPLQATVPLDADHRSRSVDVHRSRHHRFATHDGLRIARFEQLLVQLAATRPDLVEAVLHAGVNEDPRRLERVLRHLDRLRRSRLPGVRGLLELAVDLEGEPPTASELERRLFAVVAEVPGMPPVQRQAPAPWSPDSGSMVDALVPAWRLILEADGRKYHQRVADFERDRWRDAEAAVHGLHVMRFTHLRIRDDRSGIVDQLLRYGRRIGRPAA